VGQSLYATPDISEHVGCQTAWVFVDGVCIEAPVEFHLLLRRNRQGALVRRYAIPQVFNERLPRALLLRSVEPLLFESRRRVVARFDLELAGKFERAEIDPLAFDPRGVPLLGPGERSVLANDGEALGHPPGSAASLAIASVWCQGVPTHNTRAPACKRERATFRTHSNAWVRIASVLVFSSSRRSSMISTSTRAEVSAPATPTPRIDGSFAAVVRWTVSSSVFPVGPGFRSGNTSWIRSFASIRFPICTTSLLAWLEAFERMTIRRSWFLPSCQIERMTEIWVLLPDEIEEKSTSRG